MEDDILHKLLESRLIAIARGIPNSHIEAAVEALLQGGIRCVEVPFSRQGEIDTLEAIKLLKKRFGDQLLLGAGTVTNPNQVEAAAAAGATYIISPDCQKEVIDGALIL